MSKSKNKKHRFLAIILLIIIILCFAFNDVDKAVTVKIEKGLSTSEIAEVLKDNDIIKSKTMFLIFVNFSEYRGKLQYGTFNFSEGDGYFEIIRKLATSGAKKETVTVTIPEGYSVEKIIEKLSSSGLGTKKEIIQALNDNYDYEFLKHINSSKTNYKLQGFLFPATYEFYTDDMPHKIIDTMLKEFEKQYSSLGVSYDNIYEIITKASLIEREAKIDEERTKIAGVIENRLSKNMKLQIDATVVYAISDGLYDVDRVLYKDLDNNSRYNTYKYEGLPVGPIANPGIKSIKAALNPDKHNYLYYRTDENKNDGSHIFTETFESHTNANSWLAVILWNTMLILWKKP